jgi:L-lactate dehydrogenase
VQSTRTLPKVAVVGAGNVGSTCAYTLMLSSLTGEVAIANRTAERARGEALDISHGVPLLNTTTVTHGGYEVCEGAEVVVVTVGAAQEPGETRLELTRRNADIFRDAIPRIATIAPGAVLLIVSNPVDVLTYLSVGLSGFPGSRVIGSGTVLDTARLRYELRVLEVDCRDIEAFVLGEHGDSEVLPLSIVTIGGLRLESILHELFESEEEAGRNIEDIKNRVRNAAYEIIECKGSTYYAIGVCVTRIVEAILLDQRSVLTVSSLLSGEFGIGDVCLSLPCIVGRGGALERICPSLNEREIEELRGSAAELRKAIELVA